MIKVQPLSKCARIMDVLMTPVMYVVSGTLSESPQLTHRWNNVRLSPQDVSYLKKDQMVQCEPGARTERGIVHFHLPIFGGWKNYIVLRPLWYRSSLWHIGWIGEGFAGYSQIPVAQEVRVLAGNSQVHFFGIAEGGGQVPLTQVGDGVIGKGGRWKNTPLH